MAIEVSNGILPVANDLANAMQRRYFRRRVTIGALGCALAVLLVFSLGVGAVEISPAQIFAILLRKIGWVLPVEFETRHEAVLMTIRLPRILLGLTTGITLAVAGAVLQGLFRNPLADPGLIGVSGGAALGAVTVIVLGQTLFHGLGKLVGIYLLPLAAFGGALAATWLAYQLSTVSRKTNVATLLLAGIGVNALIAAVIGYLTYIATDEQLRNLTFWIMGNLGQATRKSMSVCIPLALLAVTLLFRYSRVLNAMLLGETPATHLGFDVQSVKRLVIVLSALAVGSTVAMTGAIGFIGLVVPHLVRMLIGPDHRGVLPAAALLGAILLLSADLVARTLVAPAELPTGIVTAAFGAPFFLWLLLRRRQTYA